jgi:Tfp pilus assembly protein PilX
MSENKKNRLNHERGAVALLAIFLVIFIAVLMITVELLRLSDTETISNHIEDTQAYYCAEAGIEYELLALRALNANPPTRAAGVACPSNTTPALNCTNNKGFYNPGWQFKFVDKYEKIDPDFTYCNLAIITSTGCKGLFSGVTCTGAFTRRVRAEIKRSNRGNDLRYIQVVRWREL